MWTRSLLVAVTLSVYTLAVPDPSKRANPVVKLDDADIIGAAADGNVHQFYGIPFAKPPTGDRRFRLPEATDPYTGTHDATKRGLACPQQAIKLPLIPDGVVGDAINFAINKVYGVIDGPDGEDCLNLNVVTPANVSPDSKLPVVVWIFGGGFQLGSPTLYPGGTIVSRSMQLGEPVIHVSMNHRLSAFGFLGGKEVKAAGVGNLGLHDQRQALRWVQKYIGAFGGDPTKVTIWGQSSGAISVALQMLSNGGNTEGLFRAAFMQSGSPIPVGDITNGQGSYDKLVQDADCSSASDTLDCLRKLPYDELKGAMDQSASIFSYQSLKLAWLPRADGVFLKAPPQQLVLQGSVADIPFVSGNCDDEGTLFSLSNLNVTSPARFEEYISRNYLPDADNDKLRNVLNKYSSSPIEGSPFGTGLLYALTPQFKRLAAFQGDAVFQAPRRWFLQQRADKQDTWSYAHKVFKPTPILGSAHGTDLFDVYYGGDMKDYVIHFTTYLNPNGASGNGWPKYTSSSPRNFVLRFGLIHTLVEADTYRADAMSALSDLTLEYPL